MCVVYVSGGNEIEFWGQYFDFLWSRQDQPHSVHKDDLLGCEIHVFAPNEQVRRLTYAADRTVAFYLNNAILRSAIDM
jgi:hypothetical protein